MSVTTEIKNKEQEEIIDDISENTEASDVDAKLEALKAKMAQKKGASMPAKIVEEKRKSLKFGVIGTGQAGSRVCLAFNKLGYPSIAINTAIQDLEQIDLPKDNKLVLEYGLGGAAKDTGIGHEAAETHREAIESLILDKLDETHVFLLCLSLGGGSGAGSHDVIIDILSNIGKPIVVITILPMSNEDTQTKQNALNTLAKLAVLANNKTISNLIVVDNAKLETIYSDVSHMNFFTVGNQAIVKTIDAFNHFSSMSSLDKPLDPMEWAKIFTDGEGLCIYGEVQVTNYKEDNTAIAEAIIESHEEGLLAGGFDLGQAKYAGTIIVANSNVWEDIPRGSVDYAMSLIQEKCPGADGVFRGTYVDDSIRENIVYVYSIFSGLGLPESRVVQLRKDVEADKEKTQARVKTRNTNLVLDTGVEKAVSKAEEVRQKIAKNKSTFTQNFGSGKNLDFRKKA